MTGSGLSLIHLYISYSFQPNASHKKHPQLVFVKRVSFVCIMFCSTWFLQHSRSPAMASLPQASDLQIFRSRCPPCIPDNTGQMKCILCLSSHPLHPVFSASLGARATTTVPSQDSLSSSPSSFCQVPSSAHLIVQMSPESLFSFCPHSHHGYRAPTSHTRLLQGFSAHAPCLSCSP